MTSHARGFTLIEVLLAMVLLAAGLALAFVTLRSVTAIANRGEVLAQRNEQMRAVENYLRRRITSAQRIAYDIDKNEQLPHYFSGDSTKINFVTDLPDYLGHGGPYWHEISAVDQGQRLTVAFALVQGGRIIEDHHPRPPDVLADGLSAVTFRYRGLNEQGDGLGEWQDHWAPSEGLPVQVQIDIQWADAHPWPPLVMTLIRAGEERSQRVWVRGS